MTVEECIAFFRRFHFHLDFLNEDATGYSIMLRDRTGAPAGFRFPKDVSPEERAYLARAFIESQGFDLPEQR